MKITVNGSEMSYNAISSLQEIITDIRQANTEGIAVAVNNSVISKAEWSNTKVNENDNILIIQATQGG